MKSHQVPLKILGKSCHLIILQQLFFLVFSLPHFVHFLSLFWSFSSSRYVHKFLEIQNPRVLGPAISPGAVYLASTLHEKVEMLCFQGSAAPASVFQPEDDDDSMSIISELSRLSSPSRRSSMLARSPSWSPGSARVKSLKGVILKKSSSFRVVKPLTEENMWLHRFSIWISEIFSSQFINFNQAANSNETWPTGCKTNFNQN